MTLAELQTATLRRTGSQYSAADAAIALNEGQRLFALLTLCLEATREFALTPGVWHYRMLREFSDWIAPLRVRLSNDQSPGTTAEFDNAEGNGAMFNEEGYSSRPVSGKPKLRPARLSELRAENPSWILTPGIPTRYALAGFDTLCLNRQPANPGTILQITYARSPVPLVNGGDVPEIPATDHPALWQYAVMRARLPQGGQLLAQSLVWFQRYLEAAQTRANQVRARSLGERYDKQPLENERFDLSRVLKIRPGLVPWRKETAWPISTSSK